ncbi:MAG: dephospho-CoA kinase [Spongiibacteraceae bacterium]
MFVVGLTGGIGSGKTAVSDHFNKLGIDIVDADIASRTVVEPGTPALAHIVDRFGPDILLDDNSLNRARLRQEIFANAEAKQWLEALLHPLIADEIRRRLATAKSPYVIFVSPLLIESTQKKLCDRLLIVDTPVETQLHRTMQRDNNDKEQVERIIASQTSREHRLAQADDVLENNADLDQLQRKVEELHQYYLNLAQSPATTTNSTAKPSATQQEL